jgi:hypothetical protein
MYKGIINLSTSKKQLKNSDAVETEKGTNLEFAKTETKKELKKGKLKDVRQKKGKYTRDLRRFLKLRKEKMDKPIKVSIKNSKLLIKPNTGEVAQLNDVGDIENIGQIGSPLAHSTPTGSSFRTADDENNSSFNESSFNGTKRQKKMNKSQNKKAIAQKIQAFITYVLNNAEKFNVTPEGFVIGNNNKIIKNSNLAETVRRLIDPLSNVNFSPPGTRKLRGLVSKDNYLKQLMNKTNEISLNLSETSEASNQTGGGVFHFRPTLWIRG